MAKILALASGGGHWVQLRRLSPAFDGLNVTYASVYKDYASDVNPSKFHEFSDVTRFNKLNVVKVAAQIARILWKERPDVFVTTGAGPGLIGLIIAKYFFRCRTVWIDSVANYEKLSSSGAVAGKFADVWITQWEHLAQQNGPTYWGSVL